MVLNDAVFQRVEGNNDDARSCFQAIDDDAQTLLERAKLIVNGHAQGLKDLRGGMTPAMTPNDLFNHARERQRFP